MPKRKEYYTPGAGARRLEEYAPGATRADVMGALNKMANTQVGKPSMPKTRKELADKVVKTAIKLAIELNKEAIKELEKY